VLQSICVSYLCDEVNASISICSDSQAALKALAAAKSTPQLVLETMKAFTELSIRNCVRLLWIHGQSDIVGNESSFPWYMLRDEPASQPIYAGCILMFLFWNLVT